MQGFFLHFFVSLLSIPHPYEGSTMQNTRGNPDVIVMTLFLVQFGHSGVRP